MKIQHHQRKQQHANTQHKINNKHQHQSEHDKHSHHHNKGNHEHEHNDQNQNGHDHEHEHDHDHGLFQPRQPQLQGKWKPYDKNVPSKVKMPAILIMILVWLVAYWAVSQNSPHKSHGHGHGHNHEQSQSHNHKSLIKQKKPSKTKQKGH